MKHADAEGVIAIKPETKLIARATHVFVSIMNRDKD